MVAISKEKNKGRVGENEICRRIMERTQCRAKRVVLSGALINYDPDLSDDVDIYLPDGQKKKGEVKLRKSVSKTVYDWLKVKIDAGVSCIQYTDIVYPDYLFMRKDNSPWLVCMTIDEFYELLNKIPVIKGDTA